MLGATSWKKSVVEKTWNFVWLEIANQWLEVTRQFLWLDPIKSWLWLEGLVILTRQKWLGHITAKIPIELGIILGIQPACLPCSYEQESGTVQHAIDWVTLHHKGSNDMSRVLCRYYAHQTNLPTEHVLIKCNALWSGRTCNTRYEWQKRRDTIAKSIMKTTPTKPRSFKYHWECWRM